MPRTPRDSEKWQQRRRQWRRLRLRDVAPTLALVLVAIGVLVLAVITLVSS